MVHHHYSPFQFATSLQALEDDVDVKKILKRNKRRTAKDAKAARAIPTTMSREEAHEITKTPTAFISPNSIDAMRSIKGVFGSCY